MTKYGIMVSIKRSKSIAKIPVRRKHKNNGEAVDPLINKFRNNSGTCSAT